MISYYKRSISQNSLEKLDTFKVGSWINVTNPKEEDLKFLADEYKLELDLLEDGLDENELPRIDIDNGNYYIYIKTPVKNTNLLNTLLIVIGTNFLLTISKKEIEYLKNLVDSKKKIITTQRLKSVIKILSNINDETEKKVNSIVKNVQIKKNSTTKLKEKDLEILLGYEDFLNNLVSMYNYTSVLYIKMIKKINFYEEDKEYLEDLLVDSEQGLNSCKNSVKTISNITNYYSIILSNNLNRTIKILTVFTILINIPAAVAAIYGMNVALPFASNSYVFFYIIGLIAFLITAFFIFIKKKDIF